MKVFRTIMVSITTLAVVVATTFFLIGYFKTKPGGIFVDSNPSSDVYIDGALVGTTPYTGTHEAGEIDIMLVPRSSTTPLVSYETKLTLVAGIQTALRCEFGKTEDVSSGDIISFDKLSGSETGLIVITTPENAQVSVDGVPQGFTPYRSTQISPAKHQISIKAPGYTDRIMSVKTQAGYRLSLFAKLAKNEEPFPSPTPEPKEKVSVLILTTPTGFLRVRTSPGLGGEEIAQVPSGSRYPYLDEDVATGWVKIQYKDPAPGLPEGITGWVSGEYVEKSKTESN